MATVLPWLNEAFILASAIVMGFGWWQIRRGNRETHKRLMVAGSILAALFFVSYMVKTVVVGDTTFGGPQQYKFAYQTFLQIHSVLATVAAILGIITLRFAYKAAYGKHRKIGPWTLWSWFITAFSGLMVFLLLYVIFPQGTTTNMFSAWLGH